MPLVGSASDFPSPPADRTPNIDADRNLDKQVNPADVDGYKTSAGQENWFDVDHDGRTELNCINANLGTDCLNGTSGSQCP